DGSGDACQPTLTLETPILRADGGLHVRVHARDPQGEPLAGQVRIVPPSAVTTTIPDVYGSLDCGGGFLPDGVTGEGIGYTFGFLGNPYLFDLDSGIGCVDGLTDFLLAIGSCSSSRLSFDNFQPLAGQTPPFSVCIRRVGATSGGAEFVV